MVEKLLKLATPQDPIQELVKRRDTASQEELAASQKVTELETKKAQNEAERAATQAKAKETATTELTARQAEREKPIKEEKGSIDKQLMNASFEPSKENLESQVALFSLINVIGFAIGSGGKQNAQQAMSAMNGMLEGHQKGREDVFKQEKVKFDSNFKALQSKATFLENELRHSLEEFTRDKRAADERAAAAFAEAGADFMKTYAEKNGLVATYERAKEVRKAADKAVADEQRRQERIQDKIDAETRANAQRILDDKRRLAEREDFARFAAGLKDGSDKKAAGEMPKDTKTRDEHRFRHVATENLKDILKDLEDPEIRKLIGPQNQYLPDVILNLRDKYPQLAQKLARFQSNEFLIGGKSLTQSEQRILGPIYNWRGLTAKALEDNLKEATREMSYQQGVLEEGYPGLKEMTKRYSTASGSTAAPSATSSSGAQKVMPTGAKLQAYANEHFGKDAKKAEEYLRSQGYK